MRLLVCGSRKWHDLRTIRDRLTKMRKELECIIEGEAAGADVLAGAVGHQLGIKVEKYPANWQKYGRAAGAVRNQEMLDKGRPDFVLAFHEDLAHSKGTLDMVKRAKKVGIRVEVVTGK